MNTQSVIKAFEEATRIAMLQVDSTEDLTPGMVISINDEAREYMIMHVLNHYDLSVIPYDAEVIH